MQSTQFQARLKVLKHRDDHVASVLEEAKQQLAGVVRDKKRYTEILQQLLTQAMCQVRTHDTRNICSSIVTKIYLQLLEPTLVVRCRQVDQQLVESVIPAVSARKFLINTARF